jgi:AcrR family transcriptional regulator
MNVHSESHMHRLQTLDPAAQRLSDILDSVRGVFAAKGFDGASMQDLAQAAGMSAGNFYRYFPSKDAIIEAMVRRDLAGVEEHFAAIMGSENPRQMLRQALDEHMCNHDCDEGPIWAEIIAASSRRAEVGHVLGRMEALITGYLVAVFARIASVDGATAEARFRPHAEILFTLIQGVMIRRRPDDLFNDSPRRNLTHRLIDTVLDEVAGVAPATAEIKRAS